MKNLNFFLWGVQKKLTPVAFVKGCPFIPKTVDGLKSLRTALRIKFLILKFFKVDTEES